MDVTSISIPKQAEPERVGRGGRPPQKRLLIEEYIRRQIVDGRWNPGRRLPTQASLRERFDATNQTVQEAVESLVDDGFVRTAGPRGSFVCDYPPHLSRYALIFPVNPDDSNSEVRQWLALLSEARRIDERRDPMLSVLPYFNINGHRDEPEYHRLVTDIRRERLAGLIFAASPHPYLDDPILFGSPLPRAALMSKHTYPDTPIVHPDSAGFLCRAAEFVIGRGCWRVAVIVTYDIGSGDAGAESRERQVRESLASHGVDVPSHWFVAAPHSAARTARDLTRLLLDADASRRPDAIIIADDSHVRGVTDGVAASGLAPGEFPLIVALCNYPILAPASVPVTFLGFDAGWIVQTLIEQVRLQRSNMPVRQAILCPALFEHEIQAYSSKVVA